MVEDEEDRAEVLVLDLGKQLWGCRGVVVRDGEGCFEGEGVVGYRCGEGGGGSEEYGYA